MAAREIKIDIRYVNDVGGKSRIKGTLSEIDAEVRRINKSTAEDAKRTQKTIAEATKSRVREEIKEEKRLEADRKATANRFLADMRRVESETKKTSTAMSSAFKGGFVGGFVGSIVTELYRIPAAMKATLDEAVKIAAARQSAFKGLESISIFKGINEAETKAAVTNLRLVKAGVIEIGEASTGLKNLLSTGFSLPESIMLLERFSDTAAFGKSAALTFGEAVRSATEGIRNGNSVLVDNVGLTKNLSAILKEAGFEEKDLSRVTSDATVRRALYNGLLKESTAQMGDADKLTKTYTGSTAALDMAYQNLLAAGGNLLIQNPAMIQANKELTQQLDNYTKGVQDANSETAKFSNEAVKHYAAIKAGAIGMSGSAVAALASMVTGLATGLGAALSLTTAVVESVIGGIVYGVNYARSKVVDLINWAIDQAQMFPMVPFLGTIGQQEKLNPVDIGSFSDYNIGATKELVRATNNLAEITKQLYNTSNRLGKEADDAYNRTFNATNPTPPGITGWKSFGPYGTQQRPSSTTAAPGTNTSTHAGGGSSGGKTIGGDNLSPKAKAIIAGASQLGISPVDLATLMLYETSGTLSTTIKGGKGNNYQGLIQFGPEERQKYGVKPGQTFEGQVGSAVRFLYDRGVRQGDNLLTLYKAVNGGNVNVSANASDGNGTISSHVERMIRERRPTAQKLLSGAGGDVSDEVQRMVREQSDALTKADREKHLRGLIELFEKVGLIPSGKLLKEFHDLAVADAQKSGVSTFGVTEAAVAERFQQIAAEKREGRGAVSTTGTVSTVVQGRSPLLTESQQYIQNLKISLGLEKDAEGTQTRSYQLLVRKNVIEEEIAAKLQAQAQDRADALVDLEVEYQLMIRRNRAEDARVRSMQERNDLQRDINHLEDQLAIVGENSAQRYRRAWLEATLDVKEANIRAVEEIIRANVRLDDARVVHSEQAKAKILSHLAEQKTQTDLLADAFINAFEAASSGIDKLFDKMKIGKIPIIGEFLKGQAKANLTQVFRGIVDKVFPGASDKILEAQNPELAEAKRHTRLLEKIAANTGGLPTGYNPTSGLGSITGSLPGIFGGGFGTGNGPGGTPYFNPMTGGFVGSAVPGGSAGPGGTVAVPPPGSGGGWLSQIGGMFSGAGKMFGPRKNILTGKMSGMAGTLGGIGDIAGMAGGMIGGRWGNLVSMAGMGLSIGANFGPWGAAIGGAIGGVAGLIMALLGGDKSIKRLKEAALSEFGITVKDKSVLNSLKQIGEQYFGKGKAGENARQVVQTDEAKNILRNYAEATGQNGGKIDILSHGDENWSGNQFRGTFGGFRPTGGARAMGGRVQAGYEYLIGERGPEKVTFARDGYVTPNHALSSPQTSNSGVDSRMIAGLAEAIAQLSDEVGRIRSMSAGQVLTMGAKEAPEAIREGYESVLERDPRSAQSFYKKTGAWT